MTKSNRPRDVSVELQSYRRAIIDISPANLADKIFVLQLQHTHEKAPRLRWQIIGPKTVNGPLSFQRTHQSRRLHLTSSIGEKLIKGVAPSHAL
jgi:hypothetical protein